MSTNVPGFHSFFAYFLHIFVMVKFITSRIRVKVLNLRVT